MLVHEGFVVGPLELVDVLPAVRSLGQAGVGVLHPDHGRVGVARLLQHAVDVGDHAIAVVGVGDDVLLDVDDQQGGVGAVGQRSHVNQSAPDSAAAKQVPAAGFGCSLAGDRAYSPRMAITDTTPRRAAFHAMTEGTAEDWSIIADHTTQLAAGLADRVLSHFRLLGGDSGGFAVDRLEHSLQTATRAYRANEDDEYVVCALLHDMGDTLGSYNHADIAAAILKPFVSEENHWMVEQHAVFQGYYFWHFLGGDRNARDKFAGHPWYDRTASVLRRVRPGRVRPRLRHAPARALRACGARALRASAPRFRLIRPTCSGTSARSAARRTTRVPRAAPGTGRRRSRA